MFSSQIIFNKKSAGNYFMTPMQKKLKLRIFDGFPLKDSSETEKIIQTEIRLKH